MKGIIATAAALVVATSMAMASKNTNEATNSSRVDIRQTEAAGVYNLRYASEAAGQVTVRIYNSKGAVLLKERIAHKNSFERPYNLRDLPDGIYTVAIERDGNVVEETIYHVKNLPLKSSPFFVEVNELTNDKYELTVKKAGRQVVKVKIADHTGSVYFNDIIDQQGSFKQVFDLSKVMASDVRMEVTVGNKTTIKTL